MPVFTIFLSDAKTMFLKAIYQGSLAPLDLTSCTEIIINLPNEDGSFTQLKLSDVDVVITAPPVLGQFSAFISSEVSAKLNVGVLQNVDVTFTILADQQTIRFAQCLSVFEV